ncbi:MAG: hypothetical protein HQL76_17900 [Magnetococcales bacterium]|nr:hypothetical protein [Magnetococcales bacterium]
MTDHDSIYHRLFGPTPDCFSQALVVQAAKVPDFLRSFQNLSSGLADAPGIPLQAKVGAQMMVMSQIFFHNELQIIFIQNHDRVQRIVSD